MGAKIDCTWKKDLAFEATVMGFKIPMDADPAAGGQNNGPKPKPLALAALAGCTGMDVISILRKMRIEPDYFNVSAEGELTEDHPKYYHKIHITYELKGKDIDPEKVEKAVSLSQEKYCGLTTMLRFAATITHDIKITEG